MAENPVNPEPEPDAPPPLKLPWLLEKAQLAIKLRSKEREFHGLEREFAYHQDELLAAFKKAADMKHIRDLGDAREVILRDFLISSGYLPRRYGVSETSARVISPTGHFSKEIDILIYDKDDAVVLMSREGIYEAYPIESVFGVIQVKSRLNKTEIHDAVANLASFKKLRREPPATNPDHKGFGILFAYDSDMEWKDMVHEIKKATSGLLPANGPTSLSCWTRGSYASEPSALFRSAIRESSLSKRW